MKDNTILYKWQIFLSQNKYTKTYLEVFEKKAIRYTKDKFGQYGVFGNILYVT